MVMTLDEVKLRCIETMQDLEILFQPHCNLTLLVRDPELDDADLIVTKDDLGEVINAIEQLQKRERIQDLIETGEP